MASKELGIEKGGASFVHPDVCQSSSSHGADRIFVDRLVAVAAQAPQTSSVFAVDSLQVVEEPHPHDVLCGRGGLTNHHEGNINFRQLVDLNKDLYAACPNGRHKMIVSASVMEAVRRQNPPGRFLERDTKTGLWRDIGRKRSLYKTSQALREFRAGVCPDAEKESKRQRRKNLRSATQRLVIEEPEKKRPCRSVSCQVDLADAFHQQLEEEKKESEEIPAEKVPEATASRTNPSTTNLPHAKLGEVASAVYSGAEDLGNCVVPDMEQESLPTATPSSSLDCPLTVPLVAPHMAQHDDDDALLMELIAQDPLPLFPLDCLTTASEASGSNSGSTSYSNDTSHYAHFSWLTEESTFRDNCNLQQGQDNEHDCEKDRATPELVVCNGRNPRCNHAFTDGSSANQSQASQASRGGDMLQVMDAHYRN